MKYLKLYEAFESATISKVINYIKNKVDKKSSNMFLKDLRKVQEGVDIKLSDISENDVKYLNKNNALKLRNDKPVDNEYGVWCLKFWFSLDEGYKGFTYTGNINKDESDDFSDNEIEYIKNELNIKTGFLKKLANPDKDLKHGQLIVGIFSDESDNIHYLGLAKIWRINNRIWAIQNVNSGGEPDNTRVYGERWYDWGVDDRFTKSWSLGDINDLGTDFSKIHIYTPSENPLKISENKEEEPLMWNLPIITDHLSGKGKFRVERWNKYGDSISKEGLKSSDFAVVILLDNVLKSNKSSMSKTKEERTNLKSGAVKLMSDDEIRNANIKRYMDKIVSDIVDGDLNELKNIKKLLFKSYVSDYAFISILLNRPDIGYINKIISNIYYLLKGDDKELRLERIKKLYKDSSNVYSNSLKEFKMCMDLVKNSNELPELNEFFTIIEEINLIIKKFIDREEVKSIEDITMVQIRLKSIRELTEDDNFRLISYLKDIIYNFNDIDNLSYYLKRYSYHTQGPSEKGRIEEDIKRIKNVLKYTKSILK